MSEKLWWYQNPDPHAQSRGREEERPLTSWSPRPRATKPSAVDPQPLPSGSQQRAVSPSVRTGHWGLGGEQGGSALALRELAFFGVRKDKKHSETQRHSRGCET